MSHFTLLILCYMLFFVSSSLGAISPKNIFILAGQSNMAGRGGCNQTDPITHKSIWDGYIPLESQPSPSILRLNENSSWEEAHEPLHKNIDFHDAVGIGPGMPFAHELVAKAGLTAGIIGLVPCAKGGSYLRSWMKDTDFYTTLILRIKDSYKQGGTVRALLWYQGESDASSSVTANSYKDNLERFFTDVRNDVKPIFLPIILVKIAMMDSFPQNGKTNSTIVRKGEDEVQIELPDVQIIDALELVKPNGEGFNKDRMHLDVNSQVRLGKWLADTYL